MVRVFLFLLVFLISNTYSSIVLDKVHNFIGEDAYLEHKRLIHSIFKNESSFMKDKYNARSLLIIRKLRKNGLFNLFYKEKMDLEINIDAKVSNNSVFLIKNIKESFLNLGFNFIFVKNIKYIKQTLKLKLILKSEAMINPISLHKEFQKRGIEIVDVYKGSHTSWDYYINSSRLKLHNTFNIENNRKIKIKKIINDIHLKINNAKVINISSDGKNKWHPYIVFFDKSLNPIQIIEKDKKVNRMRLFIPKKTKYIKITDKYVIKNIKHGISILLTKR